METQKRGRGRPPLPDDQRKDRLHINLPPDQLAAMRVAAAESGRSMSDLVREMIDKWLATQEDAGEPEN